MGKVGYGLGTVFTPGEANTNTHIAFSVFDGHTESTDMYQIQNKISFPGHCYCPTVWDLACVQLRDQITACSAFKIGFLFQSLHLVVSSIAKDSICGTSMHKTPGTQLFTVPRRLMWSSLSFLSGQDTESSP